VTVVETQVPVAARESVAVMVAVKVPVFRVAGTLPDTRAVESLMRVSVRKAGRAPEVTAQVYGPVPPEAVRKR
jgi:hypothetical protein